MHLSSGLCSVWLHLTTLIYALVSAARHRDILIILTAILKKMEQAWNLKTASNSPISLINIKQDKDKLWKGKESSHNTKSFQGQRVNWPSNTISEARDIASEAHQRKRKTQGNWQEKESRTEPCSIKRWQNQSITHLKKIWQYFNY